MVQRWDWMTFLHWRYEPADLRPHLPAGLEVQTFEGSAWVGLLPFRMTVRLPGAPAIPWLARFPETNVRTYVRGPDGGAGIWFFSLDAGRLVPAMTGRAGLALPYVWADMRVARGDSTVAYRCRRRWPGPRGAATNVRVEPGRPIGRDRVAPLEDFLVSRFRLYTSVAGRLVSVDAEHDPWPLRHASVVRLDQDVLQADGLPPPQGPPHALVSEGVEVRIGAPRPVTGPSDR
jgi:uncharacterized protein YqjF (DUF2071 family)